MTSYIVITDPETDPDAPLTSELAKKWRDNPIAIGEGDSTVPSGLLPTVSLGSVTTTSGASQTLSGLTLTPYKGVIAVFSNVSASSSGDFTLGGATVFSGAALGGFYFGSATFWFSPNTFEANIGQNSTAGRVGTHSVTASSTSLTVATTAGVFDSGSVRFYGFK